MSALDQLLRRIRMAIAPGRITATNDAGVVQKVQVTLGDGQVVDAVPVMYVYGLATAPHAGADVVFLAGAGDRSDGVIVAVNDQRYRLTGLVPGEVALHDDLGRKVHLTRDGIVIDAGGQPLTVINAPTVHMDGDLVVAGDISDQDGANGTVGAFRTAYDAHRHPGVQAGGSSTGLTDHPV